MSKPDSIKVVYKSREVGKDNNPYLIVKEATYPDESKYLYSSRPNRNSVKIILVDTEKNLIGLVRELSVPREYVTGEKSYRALTAIGGSLDNKSHSLFVTALKELKEETGYMLPSKRLVSVGKTNTSNQTDEIAYCFVADIKGLIPKSRELEQGETTSVVQWMSKDKFLESADAISIFCFIKYQVLLQGIVTR